jgi:polo-like kinase 1
MNTEDLAALNLPNGIDGQIIEEKILLSNGTVRIKKYKMGKHLGKGGFANCYEFINLENNQVFAAKVIPKNTLLKHRAKQKLITEIKIHKSLNNMNIVQFEHFFEDLENVYILLEMCSNQTLNELIKRRKRLTDIEVQCYSVQIIKALKYLHSNNIIHRDLKLGNLFICEDMKLKLGDFGLATKLEYNGERRRTVCGTPNYIAPEILDGRYGHSFEVDIWALGVILYTLLIGKPPFESSDVKTTYKRIKQCFFSFPEDVQICEDAKTLISDILQLDPYKRPSLDNIMDYDYFQMNTIPKLLPTSTLASPPTKSFMALFVTENNNNNNEKSEIKFVYEKFLLKEDKVKPDNFSVYVSKWIDYSSKYGFVYLLTNGNTGFYFNDESKIILNDENNINYIQRKDKRDVLHKYTTSDYPFELNKKVKLIFHFKKYFDTKTENGNSSGLIYVKRYLRTRHSILLRLSNKLIQVIFNDNSMLLLNSYHKNVIYIDSKNSQSEYLLNNAFDSDNMDMKIRLKYAKDIITFMIYNNNDPKINEITFDMNEKKTMSRYKQEETKQADTLITN